MPNTLRVQKSTMQYSFLLLVVVLAVSLPLMRCSAKDDPVENAINFAITKGREIFPGKRVGFYGPVRLDGPSGTKAWSPKWTWDIEMYVDDTVCPMQVVVTDDGSLALGSPNNVTCRSLNPFPKAD